jgi:hypothetical protein
VPARFLTCILRICSSCRLLWDCVGAILQNLQTKRRVWTSFRTVVELNAVPVAPRYLQYIYRRALDRPGIYSRSYHSAVTHIEGKYATIHYQKTLSR